MYPRYVTDDRDTARGGEVAGMRLDSGAQRTGAPGTGQPRTRLPQTGVQQTGAYLRLLLLRAGEYRTAWEQWATPTPEEIDYRAVARVLGGTTDHGGLTELARQALEGTNLTPEILHRFVEAFGLPRRHAVRLGELMRGSTAVRVITDGVREPADLATASGPPQHETLAVHELHALGPDGLPAEHQTIQVIRSTVDRLESLPYRFDTDELVVEVVHGGRVDDRVYRLTDTLYAVDIVLTQPLPRGQTTLTQLRTAFFYKSPPPPEFRRGVMGTTKNLTMWVTFHRDRLPRRIWLARWDALDHAKIIDQEPVRLDDELSVHCRYDAVERSIVGFHWEW